MKTHVIKRALIMVLLISCCNVSNVVAMKKAPTLKPTMALAPDSKLFKNAIDADDKEFITHLLVDHPDLINAVVFKGQNGYSCTALSYAIGKGNKDVVELILKQKPDLNKVLTNQHGTIYSALEIAISIGNKNVIELILTQKPDLNKVETHLNGIIFSALGVAISNGNKDVVELILTQKPDLNKVLIDPHGNFFSALDMARQKGDNSIINLIENMLSFLTWINDGAHASDINATKDSHGNYANALRFAPIAFTTPGYAKQFELLLTSFLGKDNLAIFTPNVIHNAIFTQNLEALKALMHWSMKNKEDLNYKDKKKYEDLVDAINKEINGTSVTEFNRSFLKQLNTELKKLVQSRAIISKGDIVPRHIPINKRKPVEQKEESVAKKKKAV